MRLRQTPDGNQIDLVEVMDIQGGKIKHHRIYWGWFGFQLILAKALNKAIRKRNEADPSASGS
jgi:hypothetical protein